MSKLILNKAGNVPFNVEEANVLKVYEKDGVTNVIYLHEEDGYRRTAEVLETMAAIASMSKTLIAVTDSANSQTLYINKNRVQHTYNESGKGKIQFEADGTNLEVLTVDETAAAIQVLMIQKDGESAYLNDSFTNAPDKIILSDTEGDVSAQFANGDPITVFGEGDANDAIYTVASAAYVGSNTEITVNETPALVQASNGGYTWIQK